MNKTLPAKGLIDKVRTAPGFLLWQIEMCCQRTINKALLEFDLTYTQFVVLSICCWLTKENDSVDQHQVKVFEHRPNDDFQNTREFGKERIY